MENLISEASSKIVGLQYSLHDEYTPFLKTAGTVLLGWIVVSWIWHILSMLFAPAMVSALAIFLICPTTLEWLSSQIRPVARSTANAVVEKLGLSTGPMNLRFR